MMTFRPASWADSVIVLENLREEQQWTLQKLNLDALTLLEKVIDNGFPSTTVMVDGEIAAVFGLARESLLGDIKIWMITTSLIEKEPIAFLRASRRFTERFYNTYGPLVGMVDQDFEKSKRWLRWIGFKEVQDKNFIRMRYDGGH